MAKILYVTCPVCRKKFYLNEALRRFVKKTPEQQLQCPYCGKRFQITETAGGD